jgi:MFS family permease
MGIGLFISPNNSALMGAAPRQRQGIAAGILATARNVGMVLGVGIAGAVLTTFLTRGEASGETAALFSGVQAGFLVASGVALLGAAISAIRGPERQKLPELAGVKPVKEKLNH